MTENLEDKCEHRILDNFIGIKEGIYGKCVICEEYILYDDNYKLKNGRAYKIRNLSDSLNNGKVSKDE